MLVTPLNLSITFRALLNAKSSFISAFLDKNIAQFGPLQLWPSICFDLTGSHCSALGAWWGNSPDSTAIFCSTYYLDTWTPLSFDPLNPCFIDLTSTRMRCCYLVCWGHELPVCLWRQLDSQLGICDEFFRHWRRLKSSKAVLTVRSVSMRTNEGRKETGMPWAGDQSNELSNLHAHYWVYSALQCAADSSFKQFQQYAFSSVQPCWTCLSL